MNASTVPTALFGCDVAALVTQSLDAMACYGADLKYIAVSQALCKQLCYSAAEMIDRTDAELAAQSLQNSERQAPERQALERQALERQKYWQQVADAVATVTKTGQVQQRIHRVFAPDTRTPGRIASADAHLEHFQRWETTYFPVKDTQNQLQQILSISRVISLETEPSTGSLNLATSMVGVEMPGLETASLADVPDSMHNKTADEQSAVEYSAEKLPAEAISSAHQMAEFLQIVLDSIPQYIFWKNREGVYLGSNQRWAQMAGFDNPGQVLGITDDDLPWTEAQKAWYRKCDLQVMEKDTPMLKIKQSQRQADGQLGWRETSKFPLHDDHGNVVGLLGTIEDVTERKVAEDLLKRSEATFRKLARQGELLNQLSTQIRQSLKLESIQQTTVDEVRQLFEVDRALLYRFSADWNGKVVVESVADGCVSMLGSAGSDSAFHRGYGQQYEQGYIHAISDVEAADLDSHHQTYLRSWGVKANLVMPIMVRESLWGLLIAHQCSDVRDWDADDIDLLRTLAGQVGMAIHQSNLLADAQESAAIAQEKTQQVESTLQTLKQAQAQLIQNEKMSSLGQMVAGIAHEINNPVNFIHGNIKPLKLYTQDLIELLQLYEAHYPTPDEEIQAVAEEIDIEYVRTDLEKTLSSMRNGTERIREIVLSLRNFSRMDEASCKAIDIHEGIDSTLLILQHRLKAQLDRPEIELVREYGDLPLVECYASQLNQVFMNILANAIDALESGLKKYPTAQAPQITLRTESHDESIVVTLADNGMGMPDTVRAQIFNPFFTTKPIGKGTGMGMAISHQIVVEKHSGKIECFSEEGVGTQFVITIPVKQAVNEEDM